MKNLSYVGVIILVAFFVSMALPSGSAKASDCPPGEKARWLTLAEWEAMPSPKPDFHPHDEFGWICECIEETPSPTVTAAPSKTVVPTYTPSPTVTATTTTTSTPVVATTIEATEPPFLTKWWTCDDSGAPEWFLQERCQSVSQPTATPCIDCPPAQCLLQPGTYVSAHNHFYGMGDDGNIIHLTGGVAQAQSMALVYAGEECSLCSEHLVSGLQFYVTEGVTAEDMARAINKAQGSPFPNFGYRHLQAAEAALRRWYAEGKVPGWY